MKRLFLAALLFVGFLIATPQAYANRHQTAKKVLSESDKKILREIETYFNGLKTIKSKFFQTTSTGGTADGLFYVSKPNKMRLEYNPPYPIEVIADGHYLIFHDKKLEQVTYLSLDDNPASLILKDNISFEKEGLTVIDIEKENGFVSVTVVKDTQPAAGKITLIFKDKPMALKQWKIVDPQQVTTLVSLDNTEFNVPVDESLFKFKDPKKDLRPGDRPRRNR